MDETKESGWETGIVTGMVVVGDAETGVVVLMLTMRLQTVMDNYQFILMNSDNSFIMVTDEVDNLWVRTSKFSCGSVFWDASLPGESKQVICPGCGRT